MIVADAVQIWRLIPPSAYNEYHTPDDILSSSFHWRVIGRWQIPMGFATNDAPIIEVVPIGAATPSSSISWLSMYYTWHTMEHLWRRWQMDIPLPLADAITGTSVSTSPYLVPDVRVLYHESTSIGQTRLLPHVTNQWYWPQHLRDNDHMLTWPYSTHHIIGSDDPRKHHMTWSWYGDNDSKMTLQHDYRSQSSDKKYREWMSINRVPCILPSSPHDYHACLTRVARLADMPSSLPLPIAQLVMAYITPR